MQSHFFLKIVIKLLLTVVKFNISIFLFFKVRSNCFVVHNFNNSMLQMFREDLKFLIIFLRGLINESL
jgi:hypothetical protein